MPSALDSQPAFDTHGLAPVTPSDGQQAMQGMTPMPRRKPSSVAVASRAYGKRSLKVGDIVWFWRHSMHEMAPKAALIIAILSSGNLHLHVFEAGTGLTELGAWEDMGGIEHTDPKAPWMQRIGKWSFRD